LKGGKHRSKRRFQLQRRESIHQSAAFNSKGGKASIKAPLSTSKGAKASIKAAFNFERRESVDQSAAFDLTSGKHRSKRRFHDAQLAAEPSNGD
jgi:hypothetical protein